MKKPLIRARSKDRYRKSAARKARAWRDRRRYEYQSVKSTNFDLYCVLSRLKEINDNTVKQKNVGSVISITKAPKGGTKGTGIAVGDPDIEEFFHRVKGRNCLSLEEGRELLRELTGNDEIPPPPKKQNGS